MEKIIIASLTENGIIGQGNSLPWELPDEMKHFKDTTLNSAVLMGRRTFDSLKRPLHNRLNIVLTSYLEQESKDVKFAASIKEGFEIAENFNFERLFIIGGESVYKQTIPIIDKMILSFVHGSFVGDKFFPIEMINNFMLEKSQDKESFTIKYYRKNR